MLSYWMTERQTAIFRTGGAAATTLAEAIARLLLSLAAGDVFVHEHDGALAFVALETAGGGQ